jgi:hypothetical protein
MKIVINFLLRKSRKADDGKTSVCVRITYQGNRIELATGIYSSTNHWDASRQRIKDKVIGARVDNASGMGMAKKYGLADIFVGRTNF